MMATSLFTSDVGARHAAGWPGLVFYTDMGAVAAMKQSFWACLRNWLPFLVYGILASLVILRGALALVIGLFVGATGSDGLLLCALP
jgi:hypothetical protein